MRLALIPIALAGALTLLSAARSFTSYESVKSILDAQRGLLPAALRNPDAAKWTAWTRLQDQAIRARLEQGDLDSMVNLLLLGTSFTQQPRVTVENIGEASKSGILRARVDDLVAGLAHPGDNERLVFLARLLRTKGIDPGSPGPAGVFLLSNLERVLQERRTITERAAQSKPASLLDRASLFADRGVSLDTSILPDFALEQTLRELKQRGVLREGQITRVAVVGPGLDFIDKNDESGYDYYPQQTVQPFALYDSLVRLKLARANALSESIFDISPRVLDHLQRTRQRAQRDTGYVIQLPRDIARPWPPELISYWKSLGDQVAAPVDPIRPPDIFRGVNAGRGLETRAVRIRPDVVLACEPVDLNIVLERIDLPPSKRFDLIVGTNIFLYYEPFEQALALENAGAMLKPGGLLLTNDRLPEIAAGSMRLAGSSSIRYDDRAAGDREAIGWYQKR